MQTLEEMHEHYKAVRARLNTGKPKPPVIKVEPVFVEAQPYVPPKPEPAPTPEPIVVLITPTHRILQEVAAKHGMKVSDIKGRCQKLKYTNARHEAAYRISKELKLSLPKIGRCMGFRDHTTILNSIRKYEKCLAKETELSGEASRFEGSQLRNEIRA